MEKLKKPYTAPAAELLLLAPSEALATGETSQETQWALNKWGNSTLATASIKGSNFTMWGEDGKIRR